ncbi:hypothetical protein C882_4427 [Caenispirillum salinarum AK4]|uniref:DUF1150 family protein n=1 Tax=Caenispirillum salinarum AK4 TaxID=1238182 RepID=K9HJ99_9PROT|nr:DUF1150 family protein [Caenispirillum salinarum]EKV30468.1 hypothetical protein C882_4427 [Caenispirillum salinarum AK4]
MTEKMQQSHDEFGQTPAISPSELAALGAEDVAYAKFVTDSDGQEYWSIHAGDGTQLGAAQSLDLAWAAIRQNDLEPVSVH